MVWFRLLLFLVVVMNCISPIFAEPTRFLLVRHGETDWNKEMRYQGQIDIELNETGLSQAESVANELIVAHPDVAAIYSSDLSRAYVTAQLSAVKYDLPIVKTEALREISWGDLEGVLWDEQIALAYEENKKNLLHSIPDRKKRWDQVLMNGSESYNALLARVMVQIKKIAEAHPGEKVLVFTHGRVIRTLAEESLDSEAPLKIGNCAVVHMIYDPDRKGAELSFEKIEAFSPAEFS